MKYPLLTQLRAERARAEAAIYKPAVEALYRERAVVRELDRKVEDMSRAIGSSVGQEVLRYGFNDVAREIAVESAKRAVLMVERSHASLGYEISINIPAFRYQRAVSQQAIEYSRGKGTAWTVR